MTTVQKTVIGASLVVALGAGIYGAHESIQARTEAQAAAQQRASLTQKIQQLQQERDDATTRLAAVSEEVTRLKGGQNPGELLKLRGQVGSLRQQLVQSNPPSSGFAKMMGDPTMREYIKQALTDLLKRRYAPLIQELKLTPEQGDQFIQLMNAEAQSGIQRLAAAQRSPGAGAEPAGTDKAELSQKLQALLGERGVTRFHEYSQEIPARTTIDLLDGQLGGSKLSEEQRTRLFQTVKAEPFELTHGISGDLDAAFFGSQAEVDSYLARLAESNQRVIQQAGEFLDPEQLVALNRVLTNGVTARITQAAAFTQKH